MPVIEEPKERSVESKAERESKILTKQLSSKSTDVKSARPNPSRISEKEFNSNLEVFKNSILKLNKTKKSDNKPVEMKISEISRDGIITIKFNQYLYEPDFLSFSKSETRRLIAASKVDVARDIIDIKLLMHSGDE